ncbi:hypothetical protein BHM03_00016608 [Ensete ventricosum]|nr:hypothetical protein BHM03_00016608 [Ensete ventricosum]
MVLSHRAANGSFKGGSSLPKRFLCAFYAHFTVDLLGISRCRPVSTSGSQRVFFGNVLEVVRPLPLSCSRDPSREKRNFGDCSPFGSSSSIDEMSSKTLEVMLREHDEDSIITESYFPKIRATCCMNLLGMKKAVVTRAPRSEASRPVTKPVAKEPMLIKIEPLAKKLKGISDSASPVKGASLAPPSKPRPMPEREQPKEREVCRPPLVHKGPLSGQNLGV